MWKIALASVVLFASASATAAQDQPELKVVKVELVPNSAQDQKQNEFYRNRPIIEIAPASDKEAEPIKLPTFRSYRVIVSVAYDGKLRAPFPCVVSIDAVRDGKTVSLGKAPILYYPAPIVYACFDMFPGQAEIGDYILRVSVQMEGAAKPGKSLEFKAKIVK